VGPRFSFFVSGIHAYRLDNVTGQRFLLGQYMPDHKVLVGAVLYQPRYDGTLEFVGPTEVGQNPQADANMAELEKAIKLEAAEASRIAALTAKIEREEARKLRVREVIVPVAVPTPVMGRPAPMAATTGSLPQSIDTVPGYRIAASAPSAVFEDNSSTYIVTPGDSGPSLEDVADVAAEAGYEAAQLAIEESEAVDFEPNPVVFEEFDVFGGTYRDPRSDD